jgi:murein DD-endopeptidase MepM/ murein hydrolase activator NlpD
VLPLAGAWLRDEPGQHGEELIAVPYREAVQARGLHEDPDGALWNAVTYQAYDGFIRSDLLSLVQPDAIVDPPPIVPAPGRLVHPLPGSIKTQHWGENGENYAIWQLWGHNGLDLGGKAVGTPIVAMAAGVVVYIGYDPTGYGHHVEIKHDALKASTVYCHALEIDVQVDQPVMAGDTVATVGSSGNSSGPHLHLEVRLRNPEGGYRDGTPMPRGRVDPETWAIMYGLKL